MTRRRATPSDAGWSRADYEVRMFLFVKGNYAKKEPLRFQLFTDPKRSLRTASEHAYCPREGGAPTVTSVSKENSGPRHRYLYWFVDVSTSGDPKIQMILVCDTVCCTACRAGHNSTFDQEEKPIWKGLGVFLGQAIIADMSHCRGVFSCGTNADMHMRASLEIG